MHLEFEDSECSPYRRVRLEFMDTAVSVEGGYDHHDRPFGHALARMLADYLHNMDDIGLFGVYLEDPDDGELRLDFEGARLSVYVPLESFLDLVVKAKEVAE